jgi:hypothetical protein
MKKLKTPTRRKYQTPKKPKKTARKKIEGKRLRDWAAEDAAQVRRGRIDLLIAPDCFNKPAPTGKRGRPRLYSQTRVFAAATLRQLEQKAYRPLEGYVQSLALLLGLDSKSADHVTFWRRAEKLDLPPLPHVEGPRIVTVDSTGIKVYGPGEWRRHKHAEHIERTYHKFHAVRDAGTGLILDWALTASSGHGSGDALVGAWMLENLVEEGLELEAAAADGAYDTDRFRAAVWRGSGRALVPPRVNAVISTEYEGWQRERNQQIRACEGGAAARADWKDECGYHVRSLAETTFSRHHALFGERIMSKIPERQRLEMALRVMILNEGACRSLA